MHEVWVMYQSLHEQLEQLEAAHAQIGEAIIEVQNRIGISPTERFLWKMDSKMLTPKILRYTGRTGRNAPSGVMV